MDQQLYANAVWFISRLDRRVRHLRDVGCVYALRNAAFKNPLLKIGMTKTSPHQRAQELGSASGVPGMFDLVYVIHSMNCAVAEHHVHQELADHRTTGEFFDVPLATAVHAMDEAAAMFPINMDLARPGKRGGWGDEWLPQVFQHEVVTCPQCGQKNKVRALAIPVSPKCGSCGADLRA